MAVQLQPFEFDAGGLRLVGDRWTGAGDRGVVVLMHGGGQTRHSWARTGERLAEAGWATIAFDARGHGDSGWDAAGDYTLDAFAGDLVALVATLDRPPVLVGASLGGITALLAAGEHPGLARALVLVDVVVEVEPEGVARILAFMTEHSDGFFSLDEVADAIAAYNPLRRHPRNLEGLRKNVRQRANGRWYWHWDPAFIRLDDEPQRRIPRERLRSAAAQIQIPTLLAYGAQSDVVSAQGLADMQRLIPTSERIEVAHAGHMVAGDDNDAFAAQLAAFLTRVDDSSPTGKP